jgi:YidC/Oxa1 family membrane protein insertase
MVNLIGGFMSVISSAVTEMPTHLIAKFIEVLFQAIGNYGWAVILFTLIIKLALSPLDVWQKVSMRKNNRAMERMKPELEKLQKQCGNNKELYQQKQMAMYKKNGYSMVGSSLPTILTLVIFFVIFAGFRAEVKYTNESMYEEMRTEYYTVLETGGTVEEAQAAVDAAFEENWADKISFLWIDNIFMPDTWKESIASYSTYTGTKIGGIGATAYWRAACALTSPYQAEAEAGYNAVMGGLAENHGNWNGYLI